MCWRAWPCANVSVGSECPSPTPSPGCWSGSEGPMRALRREFLTVPGSDFLPPCCPTNPPPVLLCTAVLPRPTRSYRPVLLCCPTNSPVLPRAAPTNPPVLPRAALTNPPVPLCCPTNPPVLSVPPRAARPARPHCPDPPTRPYFPPNPPVQPGAAHRPYGCAAPPNPPVQPRATPPNPPPVLPDPVPPRAARATP